LSGEVFEQDGVSRAEPPRGSISDHHLHLASGEENRVLAPWRIVPIAETAVGRTREGDTGGGLLDGPLNLRWEQVQVLKVRLTIMAGITSDKRHWQSSWVARSGRLSRSGLALCIISRIVQEHNGLWVPICRHI
jgi:hypothetical protein